MFSKVFILCMLVKTVFSDECVTFNFENDFDNLFSSDFGVCNLFATEGEFSLGYYSSIAIEPPHNLSSTFISPDTIMSCTASFTFPMSEDGYFEIYVYMESEDLMDQVNVFLNEVNEGGVDTQLLTLTRSAMLDFEPGWTLLSGNLLGGGTGNYEGYVSIMGQASAASTVIIDYFRYIPSSYTEAEINEHCPIYMEDSEENISNEDGNTEEGGSGSGEDNLTEEISDEDNNGEGEDVSYETDDNSTEDTGENETEEDIISSEAQESEEENVESEEEPIDPSEENTEEEIQESEENTNQSQEEESSEVTDTEEDNSNETTTEITIETSDSEEDIDVEIDTTEENTENITTEENTTSETIEQEEDSTEENTENPDESVEETQEPIIEEMLFSFWNPLTITMTVLVSVILLGLLCYCCYECGKRRARDRAPLLLDDIEMPPPITVPRVTTLYTEPSSLHSYSK